MHAENQTQLVSGITLPDIPSETLDLATQTDYDADANGWIVSFTKGVIDSKGWHSKVSTDGGTTTWTVPDGTTAPFAGASSSTSRYTLQNGSQDKKTHAIRFTGAEKASFLVSYGNNALKKSTVSLFSYNGTAQTLIETKVVEESSTKLVQELLFSNLSTSTTYIAYIYGNDGNNNADWYEFALKGVDTRAAVNLSFASPTANANLGEDFTAPTLTVDPVSAESEVTYSSSATNVATVDAASGNVTIKAAGTTTITAAISGSETYNDASASYTLTVVDPNIKTVTATFPFSTGAAGQVANFVYSPEQTQEYFYASGTVTLGTNLSYNGQQALKLNNEGTGDNSTKILVAASEQSSANEITFTISPRKGVTFIPTAVRSRATRCGTDGGKMKMEWTDSEHSSVTLGSAAASKTGDGVTDPARDNNATQNWTDYSYDLTAKGVEATTGDCGLKILIYDVSGKNYALGNIIIEGKVSGDPEEETMYAVTTGVTPESAGSVIQNPAGASLAEGSAIEFSATANTGYKFLNKWTVNGTEYDGVTYSTESLSEDLTVVAHFKKLYAINFSVGEGDKGTSNPLTTVYAETTYTTPNNYYISKAGYTTTGWTDGENNYEFGEEITLTGDITLTPIFVENTKSIANTGSTDVKVTYGFNNTNGDPAINLENSSGYYVMQAIFDGKTIDVPMIIDNRDNVGIDGYRGKTNNVGRANAQINTGAKFTLPAVKGMTVTINKASGSMDGTTIAGDEYTETAIYTYTGIENSIDIIFTGDNLYINSVVVTYPAATEAITTNTHGNASHVASKALDFSGVEGLKAYIATAADAQGITLAEVTAVPAGTAFVVQATEKSAQTYYIPTTTEDVTLTAANVFQGSNSATAIAGNATYALSKSKGMFAKVKSGVTIPTGVAYVNITNGAKETLAFFFGEATGIAEAEAAETQQGGVRKQLINGRLVIIKGDKRYNAAGAEF